MSTYQEWSSDKIKKNMSKTEREIKRLQDAGTMLRHEQLHKLDLAKARHHKMLQEIKSREFQISLWEGISGGDCVMCGREGALDRSDGKPYCSMCWTVWNS